LHTAYGVCLESQLALNSLLTRPCQPSVDVALSWVAPGSITESGASYGDKEAVLSYAGLCRVEVSQGRHIEVDAEIGVPEVVLEHYVLGVGMGVLLHQQEKLGLHASAVLSPAGGVLFLGESTWGKSTLAALFYVRGWPLIADDISSLDLRGPGEVRVMPAYPSIRLWPETARFLDLEAGAIPIYPGAEKLRVDASVGFPSEAAPVSVVYVLDQGNEVGIDAVRPHNSVAEFVRHSFAGRLLGELGAKQWHFEAVAELARRVPVRRLTSPRTDLVQVRQIVDAVEADLATLAS
jgi:hypothetical protein